MSYNILRHLGHAIFFGSFSGDLLIAMFTAYFDASGDKRQQVLSVAGFVSHVKRWERFDGKWSIILKRYNASAFRYADFASSRGEFKDWKGKSELRRNFIADLVECIRQDTKRGFAASVALSEYTEVNGAYKLEEHFGSPYVMCASACLGALEKWLRKGKYNPSQVLVIVEDGDEDQGAFLDRARHDGYKAVPLPKSDAQAFQAGDLAAWKCRTTISNAIENAPVGTADDAVKILRSLDPIRAIVHDNKAHDKPSLLALCERANIPRRRERITV